MSKAKCRRCGKCCDPVHLSVSPEDLRFGYKNWRNNSSGKWQPEDICLLYPMLKYVRHDKKLDCYLYRCVHFDRKDDKATCSIQEFKPKMCSGFPYYDRPQEIRIGQAWQKPEGVPEDCGYIVKGDE